SASKTRNPHPLKRRWAIRRTVGWSSTTRMLGEVRTSGNFMTELYPLRYFNVCDADHINPSCQGRGVRPLALRAALFAIFQPRAPLVVLRSCRQPAPELEVPLVENPVTRLRRSMAGRVR